MLQQELAGQLKPTRLRHARRLRMGTGVVEAAGLEEWEQLQALLLSVTLDAEGVETEGMVDEHWLANWTSEISSHVPGFMLPSAQLEIESQEPGHHGGAATEAEHDLDMLR